MSIDFAVTASIALLSLVLGILVLLSDHKNTTNRLFFGFNASVSIWIFSSLVARIVSIEMVQLVVNIGFAATALMGYYFLAFCITFPDRKVISRPQQFTLLILPVLFIVLTLFNLVAKAVPDMVAGFKVAPGFLYIPYSLFLAAYVIASVTMLLYKYRKYEGVLRKQLLYVISGFFSYALIALITSLVLPSLIDYPNIYRWGIYSVIFFLCSIAYAIIKHQLLDIKVIATQSLVVIINIALLFNAIYSDSLASGIVRFSILAISSLSGYILIRSVMNEIKTKEKIQKLAKDLEEANTHLQELDKVKDDFLSMASHELNTPIAAIEGYLSMILVEKLAGELPPKAKTYLDSVYSSSQRLAHLVRDLLNVSRIESGRIHLLYEQKPVEDIINQAIMEITPKVREAKHTLTFEKPAKPLPITWLDATRITEIVINIIGNAIKYTDPGGKIDIKALADDQKIVVSVADNGRGIPKERQDAIFQKFTQADVLKDQAKGTGLGMYISKKFIELHKGQIWFHSDGEGKGTTFFISLPIVKEKPIDEHEGEGPVLH